MHDDDDDIQDYVSARKKDSVESFHEVVRNDTLEEAALEFDKMPFGDTSASFAAFVRSMKRNA